MILTPKTNSPLKLRFVLTPGGMDRVVVFEVVNYNVAKIDVVTGSILVNICNSEGENATPVKISLIQDISGETVLIDEQILSTRDKDINFGRQRKNSKTVKSQQ